MQIGLVGYSENIYQIVAYHSAYIFLYLTR